MKEGRGGGGVRRNEMYKCRKFERASEMETVTKRGCLSLKEVIIAVNEEMPV